MKREGREVRKEGKRRGRKQKKGKESWIFLAAKHNTITDGPLTRAKLTVCIPTFHLHRGWDPAFPSQSRPFGTLPNSCGHLAGTVQGTGTALWLPMGFHSSHMTCCTGQWEAEQCGHMTCCSGQ